MHDRKPSGYTLGTGLMLLLLVGMPQAAIADDEVALYADMYLVADKREGEQRWKKMTPEQREQARERYEHFKQLPAEEQERIRERYEHFNQLPPEQRKALREQWDKMSPEERKAFNKKQRKHHEWE